MRHNVYRAGALHLRERVLPAQFVPESMPAFDLLGTVPKPGEYGECCGLQVKQAQD